MSALFSLATQSLSHLTQQFENLATCDDTFEPDACELFEKQLEDILKPSVSKEEISPKLTSCLMQALEDGFNKDQITAILTKFFLNHLALFNEVIPALIKLPKAKSCPLLFAQVFDFVLNFSDTSLQKILASKTDLLRSLFPLLNKALRELNSAAFIEALKVAVILELSADELKEMLRQLHNSTSELSQEELITFLMECVNGLEKEQTFELRLINQFVQEQSIENLDLLNEIKHRTGEDSNL